MNLNSKRWHFSMLCLFSGALWCSAQDKVVLINGDTLDAQVLKVGKGHLTIKESDLERELNSLYVSKVLSQNGKKILIRETPENLDFEPNLLIVKYSPERASEIAITFPNSVKREFKTPLVDAYKDLPDEYFTAEGSGITGVELAERYSKFLGYGCNAFLVIVSQTKEGAKYVFYSNPISFQTINRNLIGQSYKLVNSQVSEGTLRSIAELGAKPFTMKLNEDGKCVFKQGNKETLLAYKVFSDGKIVFTDPKRPSDPTTYEIVFLDNRYMRYTQFMKEDKIVTKKVEVIQ